MDENTPETLQARAHRIGAQAAAAANALSRYPIPGTSQAVETIREMAGLVEDMAGRIELLEQKDPQ